MADEMTYSCFLHGDHVEKDCPKCYHPPVAPDPFAHLSSAPISPSAEVIEFVAWIDRLLDDEDCQYASDTLTGMRASAKGYDRVTDAMRQAVQNIEDGAERGRQAKRGQGGFRRRYEGYGDGSRRRW